MEFLIWLIIGLVAGGVLGALATWYISRARGGSVSAMQIKQENERFRNEVTEHFVETGRLINQMTDSYKQVFDHLSSGAEKLVDEKSLAERLPPAGGEEVRLSQFGAPTSGRDAPRGPDSGRSGQSRFSSSDAAGKSSTQPDPLQRDSSASNSESGRGSSAKSNDYSGSITGSASLDESSRTPDNKPDNESGRKTDGKSSGESTTSNDESASAARPTLKSD